MSLLIEHLDEVDDVYDITVEDNHNFYANNILVHNCTEITLRSDNETSFVCNLASPNLAKFSDYLKFDTHTKKLAWCKELEESIRIFVRALDNVITVGLIPHANGRRFQDQDRAIGLGVMGWTDCLYNLGIDFETVDHIHFCNEVYKQISITAIHESHKLSIEKGSYATFLESSWAEGKLPKDSLINDYLVTKFDIDLSFPEDCFITESELRSCVRQGMRNSTLMAIAPTATIANIAGCSPCTEHNWDVISTKSNLSGTFRVFSKTAVENKFGLPVKAARQFNQLWAVHACATRQIHIDQSQSLNIYIDPSDYAESPELAETEGKQMLGDFLDDLYFECWRSGVKTTYYLYSQSNNKSISVMKPGPIVEEEDGKFCAIDAGPECEACQ